MTTVDDDRSLECQRIVEMVTDYIEGAMASDDRDRFERHLDTCPHCMVYLQQMRTAIRALGHVHADEYGADAQRELLNAFRGWVDSGDAGGSAHDDEPA